MQAAIVSQQLMVVVVVVDVDVVVARQGKATLMTAEVRTLL